MEIKLKIGDDDVSTMWDELVNLSSHGTLFHLWKWLKIMEKHTNSKLYPIVAYNGSNIVGICPIFKRKKGFINLAASPPIGSYLLYLGPIIINYENLKQDKKENILISFQNEIDRFVFSELKSKWVRLSLSPGIFDCRPIRWNGYDVIPQYTYRINLVGGEDLIWKQFDRKLRVDINRANREGVIIKEGNKEDLEFINNAVYKRIDEQRMKLTVSKDYLLDLFKEFSENMKIFVAYYKEDKIGGMICLTHKDIIYTWEGMSKIGLKGISPNDLLQWEAIKWACKNGFKYYENMDGGDIPRLRNFKSKYNPRIEIWFSAIKHSSLFYKILDIVYKNTINK